MLCASSLSADGLILLSCTVYRRNQLSVLLPCYTLFYILQYSTEWAYNARLSLSTERPRPSQMVTQAMRGWHMHGPPIIISSRVIIWLGILFPIVAILPHFIDHSRTLPLVRLYNINIYYLYYKVSRGVQNLALTVRRHELSALYSIDHMRTSFVQFPFLSMRRFHSERYHWYLSLCSNCTAPTSPYPAWCKHRLYSVKCSVLCCPSTVYTDNIVVFTCRMNSSAIALK